MAARSQAEPDDESTEDHPIDWRVRLTTQLIPPAYPRGLSHRAGAIVVHETLGRNAQGLIAGFNTPSSVALALNLAVKAADQAHDLWQLVEDHPVASPYGPGASIIPKSTPFLYDYLEQCMIAVTFSFQALEAYCNELISYEVSGTYTLLRDKGHRKLKVKAAELERIASTEEKLGTILPELLGVPSPKGRRQWEAFVKLKEDRDATIHIKSRDSAPRIMEPIDLDERTLFHRFLGANVREWPKAAVTMILYFASIAGTPPYLEHTRKILGIQAKGPATNQSKRNQPPRGDRR